LLSTLYILLLLVLIFFFALLSYFPSLLSFFLPSTRYHVDSFDLEKDMTASLEFPVEKN